MDAGSWHCTGGSNQDHPQEKEMQKGKRMSDKALQIGEKRTCIPVADSFWYLAKLIQLCKI